MPPALMPHGRVRAHALCTHALLCAPAVHLGAAARLHVAISGIGGEAARTHPVALSLHSTAQHSTNQQTGAFTLTPCTTAHSTAHHAPLQAHTVLGHLPGLARGAGIG